METTKEPKVRVYQAQSRLVGLHAACVLIMGRITGSVTPAFGVTIPKGTAEALRLSFCELCHFRTIPEKSFIHLYNDTRVRLQGHIPWAEERVVLQGQFEAMEYVRRERIEAKVAEGRRLNLPCVTHNGGGCGGTLESGHQRLCEYDPEITNLTPSLRKRVTEIAVAMRPTPPPIRPTPMKNVRTHRPTGPKSSPRGLVGPGGVPNLEKRGPAPRGATVSPAQTLARPGTTDPAALDAAFMFLEAEAVARRKPAHLHDISERDKETGVVTRIALQSCTDPKCLKHGAKPAKGFKCLQTVGKK